MESVEKAKHESAAKFFHNNIIQMRAQLNGILSREYREYLLMKIDCYELAENLIEEEMQK